MTSGQFDEELLDLSIKRINQPGLFEEFKREDMTMEVDSKEDFVVLTFKLKELP